MKDKANKKLRAYLGLQDLRKEYNNEQDEEVERQRLSSIGPTFNYNNDSDDGDDKEDIDSRTSTILSYNKKKSNSIYSTNIVDKYIKELENKKKNKKNKVVDTKDIESIESNKKSYQLTKNKDEKYLKENIDNEFIGSNEQPYEEQINKPIEYEKNNIIEYNEQPYQVLNSNKYYKTGGRVPREIITTNQPNTIKKIKKNKKRSKQKNIRKDTRPEDKKPEFLKRRSLTIETERFLSNRS